MFLSQVISLCQQMEDILNKSRILVLPFFIETIITTSVGMSMKNKNVNMKFSAHAHFGVNIHQVRSWSKCQMI